MRKSRGKSIITVTKILPEKISRERASFFAVPGGESILILWIEVIRGGPYEVANWIKRLGFWGFLFFLVKGLLWLLVPGLLALWATN